MNVYDLSVAAVSRMVPVDLATLNEEPGSPIGRFDFHGCICGVASYVGQPPWELHNGGDEFIHVLAGAVKLTILANGAEETRALRAGDVVLVPKGCWHRSHAADGVTLLHMTPREGGAHSWTDPREQQP